MFNLWIHRLCLFPGEAAAAAQGPFLQEKVMSLQGLDITDEQQESAQPPAEVVTSNHVDAAVPQRKPADKKSIKPKWLKM